MNCKNCLYFNSDRCRRYPPVLVHLMELTTVGPFNNRKLTEFSPIFRYPNCCESDWCGEWTEVKNNGSQI